MQKILVSMPEWLVKWLDEAAKHAGISRAAALRFMAMGYWCEAKGGIERLAEKQVGGVLKPPHAPIEEYPEYREVVEHLMMHLRAHADPDVNKAAKVLARVYGVKEKTGEWQRVTSTGESSSTAAASNSG